MQARSSNIRDVWEGPSVQRLVDALRAVEQAKHELRKIALHEHIETGKRSL